MKIIKGDSFIYSKFVQEYINKLEKEEAYNHCLEDYLLNARYDFYPRIDWKFNLPITLIFIVNKNIQYDLPHTMGNCIVLPEKFLKKTNKKSLSLICHHEALHVYCRYYKPFFIDYLMKKLNLVFVCRKRFLNEITNPDEIYGKIGLIYKNKIICPIMLSPFNIIFITISKNKDFTFSSKSEKDFYKNSLKFSQNYAVEEIFAEIICKNLKF